MDGSEAIAKILVERNPRIEPPSQKFSQDKQILPLCDKGQFRIDQD
jgi:hypothetical protein